MDLKVLFHIVECHFNRSMDLGNRMRAGAVTECEYPPRREKERTLSLSLSLSLSRNFW